jgi:transcriptional repressor NrdR
MRCPFCAQPSNRVIDSRVSKDGFAIRRRRECEECGRRFTTYERVEESVPMVVKKDGRREAFDRAKIISGIKRACEKRPVSADVIDRTVDEIERQLLESGEREVSSSIIGEAVMAALQRIDEVAYVRFASVYRSFKDINEFMEELKELLRQGEERKGLPK